MNGSRRLGVLPKLAIFGIAVALATTAGLLLLRQPANVAAAPRQAAAPPPLAPPVAEPARAAPSTFGPPGRFGPLAEVGPSPGQFRPTSTVPDPGKAAAAPAAAEPASAGDPLSAVIASATAAPEAGAKPPRTEAPVAPASVAKAVVPRRKPDIVVPPAPTGVRPERPVVADPGVMIPPQAMTAAQRDTLNRISIYFNGIRTMRGDFIQIGPQGEQSEGEFYMERPGKVRFHYKPPVRVDVISDGRTVAIEDRSAMTQDVYPLSKTPLKHLLAERVDLASSQMLGGYREEPDLVSIELAETSFGDGRLTLIFDRASHQLRQWVISDAQGRDTSVAIYNVRTDVPIDPNLFKIYASMDFR